MPVKLDSNNIAIAWGDTVQGDEIPDPPTEMMGSGDSAQWDPSTSSWSIVSGGSA